MATSSLCCAIDCNSCSTDCATATGRIAVMMLSPLIRLITSPEGFNFEVPNGSTPVNKIVIEDLALTKKEITPSIAMLGA